MYSPLLGEPARGAQARRGDGAVPPRRDALQLYVTMLGLGHFWVANRHTLSTIFGEDLGTEAALEARERHVIDVVLATYVLRESALSGPQAPGARIATIDPAFLFGPQAPGAGMRRLGLRARHWCAERG